MPKDPEILGQPMLIDLSTQLDKTNRLLRQLLEARHRAKSEQLSPRSAAAVCRGTQKDVEDHDELPPPDAASGQTDAKQNSGSRGR